MIKNNYKRDLRTLKNMTKSVSSLNESLRFSPEKARSMESYDSEFDDEGDDVYGDNMPPMQPSQGSAKDIVDGIRKTALKAMADHADDVQDPYYIILKKIWQIADKNPDENLKGEEK